jgi:hypothetical protein
LSLEELHFKEAAAPFKEYGIHVTLEQARNSWIAGPRRKWTMLRLVGDEILFLATDVEPVEWKEQVLFRPL